MRANACVWKVIDGEDHSQLVPTCNPTLAIYMYDGEDGSSRMPYLHLEKWKTCPFCGGWIPQPIDGHDPTGKHF